jgi:hydrogenase nickel incorporation protein HypB
MRRPHHPPLASPIDRLLDGLLGPLRAHRFGHDHDDDPIAAVLDAVAERAEGVHERLAHDHDVFAVELLGATGSGKTALVERLLERAPPDERVAVVAGDVAGDDDARRYREHGVRAVDVTTGKDCHLDPQRVDAALDEVDLRSLDTLYVENVGNMVCPVDFPLGTHLRVVVVSVTEGEDVVRKHPLLFQACDLAVVNKVDVADALGTDVDRLRADVSEVAPDLPVVTTSARTGAGLDELERRLRTAREDHANHAD